MDFKFPWDYSLLCFYGNLYVYSYEVKLDFMIRILFDYKYDKYLGAFRFVFGKQEQWNN